MQGLRRIAAALLLRAWVSVAMQGTGTIPRPTDAPQAHSPGTDSDRILIFGSGPAVGWGVSSHDLALPGALARALSASTRRGADVRLVTVRRGFLRGALDQLTALELRRLSAIVVILGVDDAVNFTSEATWKADLTRLLHFLEQHTSDGTHVYVHGIQSIRAIPLFDNPAGALANRHAHSLNAITERVCRAVPRSVFLPMQTAPFLASHRLRNSNDYRHWGEFLTGAMAENLNRVARGSVPVPRAPAARLAPNSLPPEESDHNNLVENQKRLDRIVALTQQSFGTASAVFTVQKDDRLEIRSSAGPVGVSGSWAESFSARVVGARGAFIVGDARGDTRVPQRAAVGKDPHIRFFAGFPIESPSGDRIGALCVFDPQPQCTVGFDSVLLRQLALMIQNALHANGEFTYDTD